ncbi:unnamed protein product [Coffea canephora]|uniref:Uncharacterized protein n=1 Tax=Coffea canephora TaxID=49390 RepID=A0A068TPY3_COFCA|nr:unnamed protein product [Coffea canephora]
MFELSVIMSLYFDDKNVTNGSDVKPSLAASAPLVTIGGEPHKFYTLVMIDPDDPSPSEPTLREWAHWIVTDIPGGSIASQGKEILSYMPPHPQVGIHRYIYSDPVSAGGTTRFSGTAKRPCVLLNQCVCPEQQSRAAGRFQ